MHNALSLITPPTAEPISVAAARAHSRVTLDVEDSIIAGYIASARDQVESITRRALMPSTFTFGIQQWPGRNYDTGLRNFSTFAQFNRWNYFQIPKPPLIGITTFVYTDTNGNTFPMTQSYNSAAGNYLLDLLSVPARVTLPFSGIWPTTILSPSLPIQLTFQAGYKQYAGVATVASTGIVTWVSGTPFDASLVNTWIDIGPNSYIVTSFTDATHITVGPVSQVVVVPGPGAAFSANLVPMAIRHAILLLVCHFYDNRQVVIVGRGVTSAEIDYTVDALLAPHRIWMEDTESW